MEDDIKDPMDPFSGIFNMITASLSARSTAAMVAAMQTHHYQQLRAEGMSDKDALELTARTSESIAGSLASVINAVGRNAQGIAKGMETIAGIKFNDDKGA